MVDETNRDDLTNTQKISGIRLGEIPEVVPERHLLPEFPEGTSLPGDSGAPENAGRGVVAPEFIGPAPAAPGRSRPVPRTKPGKPGKPAPVAQKRSGPRYTLLTAISAFRSLSITFAAAVTIATIFMWWTSPDFLPAQARLGLATVQATARQVTHAPTPLPTPIWFNRIGVLAGHSGISPSSGLPDPGAVCPDGFNELTVTTGVADRVVAILRGRGFSVDLLEEFDPRLTEYQAAALISLHATTCEDFGYGGFISAYPAQRLVVREQDIRLNECVRENYGAITGLDYLPNSVTHDMTLYHVWNKIGPRTPAIILEVGFLGYNRDLLQNQQDRLANGVVNGVLCFLDPIAQATLQALPTLPVVPTPSPVAGETLDPNVPMPTIRLP